MKNLKSLKEAVIAVLIDRLDEQDPQRKSSKGLYGKAAKITKTTPVYGGTAAALPAAAGAGVASRALARAIPATMGLMTGYEGLKWMMQRDPNPVKPGQISPRAMRQGKPFTQTITQAIPQAKPKTTALPKADELPKPQAIPIPKTEAIPQSVPMTVPKAIPRDTVKDVPKEIAREVPKQQPKTRTKPKKRDLPDLPSTEKKPPQMPKFGIEAKKKPKEQPVKKPTTTDRKDTTSYVGHYYKGLEKRSGTQYK